eukprot:TRINITY_DN19925_c0_g1_i1.p1 TRINITY_DN19925_c0_g1~~TRINITY_DN19925_c0_g1_i1.p1  ORF type:complete len:700 (+),score=141.79 TRINITY_DN19925_c0_g1_i1:34-2133(+)
MLKQCVVKLKEIKWQYIKSRAWPKLVKHNAVPAVIPARDLINEGVYPLAVQKAMKKLSGPVDLVPYVVAKELLTNKFPRRGRWRYMEMDRVLVKNTGLKGTEGGELRTPIAVLLGHVDHGKTTLLDVLAETAMTAAEPGDITQTARAYNINRGGHRLTVIDTPGHKMFKSMRRSSSFICDVVVLVVDLTEGVKRQTKESIKLAFSFERPIVVAMTKLDLVPPENLVSVVRDVAQQLRNHAVPVTVRTPNNMDKPLKDGTLYSAVPISATLGMQVDLLYNVIMRDTKPATARITGVPCKAYILESRHNLDARNDTDVMRKGSVAQNETASDLQKGRNPTQPSDAYNAAFAPLHTRSELYSDNPEKRFANIIDTDASRKDNDAGLWSLSCICYEGVFTKKHPAAWLAGFGSYGETTQLLNEWGMPIEQAVPGQAFQLRGLQGQNRPDPHSHVVGIESATAALETLQHRELVMEYLRGGGDPALLTPEGTADAYYWIQNRLLDGEREEEVMDVNDVERLGLLCDEWGRTGKCHDSECRKEHPKNIATEPPIKTGVVLVTDSKGSMEVVQAIAKKMSNKSVQFDVLRTMVGSVNMGLINEVASAGDFVVPVLCYRINLPLHVIPITVTQKVDTYEVHHFQDVARVLHQMSTERYSTWAAAQLRRWKRFSITKKLTPPAFDKSLRDLLTEEDTPKLHDVYGDSE